MTRSGELTRQEFDIEAARREVERAYLTSDGGFNLEAIYAATQVKGSALYGLLKRGCTSSDVVDMLERIFGEDNIGYGKAAGGGLDVGLIRNDRKN